MITTWQIWHGAFPAPYCNHLVDRLLKYPAQPATIGFEEGFHEDNEFRRSVVRWLDPYGSDLDITTRIMEYVKQANRSTFGFDLSDINEIQFTEYHAENAGHYDWHQDIWLENPAPFDRKLSVSIQLSAPEDYEGGVLELQNASMLDFQQQGSVIVFPSFLTHRVTPVTKGTRRSLVTWVEGPKFR